MWSGPTGNAVGSGGTCGRMITAVVEAVINKKKNKRMEKVMLVSKVEEET